MNIVVHYPKTEENKKILNSKVSQVYGITVFDTIEKLHCSKEQKIKLLDEIIEIKKLNLY